MTNDQRPMTNDQANVVPISIQGQQYPIRTSLDPEYVLRLAAFVDEKMRSASDSVSFAVACSASATSDR